MFLLFSGYLVFNMQTGFAMLSAGSVRGRAAKSIILKNLLDIATGGLYWWAIGYAFAFGDRTNANGDATDKFVGTQYFFFSNLPTSGYGLWFFEFTFAVSSRTYVKADWRIMPIDKGCTASEDCDDLLIELLL